MSQSPLIGADLGSLRQLRWGQLAVRFAFGALISLVAGLVGEGAGALAGGALLAFPAILPATLTLIEREEGLDAAVNEVRGSVLGAIALEAFALTAYLTLGRLPPVAALALALAAWVLVGLSLYLAQAGLRRRDARRRG